MDQPGEVRSQPPGNPAWALEVVRVVILLISAFLLTSLGGAAAMAAPASLPLLWWSSYSGSPATRVFSVLIGALTALQTGWIVAYITVGERFAAAAGLAAAAFVAVTYSLTAVAASRRMPAA